MNRPSNETEEFLGELRLGGSLTSTSQLLVRGAALLLGLLLLLGGRATAIAEPWWALVSALAGLALGLTLLSVMELMGGSGGLGGTYVLIEQTWGGIGAFLSGWCILAGSAALVASLARTASMYVLLFYPALHVPPALIALLLFGALVLAQLMVTVPRRRWLWLLLVLVAIVLALALLGSPPRLGLSPNRSTHVPGFFEVVRATGALMALYGVFEALLLSRHQASEPWRLLSRVIPYMWVVTTLSLIGVGVAVLRLGPAGTLHGAEVTGALWAAGFLPPWLLGAASVVALLLAMDGCLTVGVRQIHILSRMGGVPGVLHRSFGPFSLHPLPFFSLAVGIVPLIALATGAWLSDTSAAMFLVTMTLLNVAAIHSYRTEPERRRPFALPFPPLVPGLAIAANVLLLSTLPLWGVAAWLVLGLLVYLGYARGHQVAAQEGVVVFGRSGRHKQEGAYRILVPLGPGDERDLPLGLAVALARQMGGEVVPLQVIPVRDPLAIEEGRRIAEERNVLFRWSTRVASDAQVPVIPITRLARSAPQGILDSAAEEQCDLILMSWPGETASSGARMGRVLDPVVRGAPCDVAVVTYHQPDRAQGQAEAPREGGWDDVMGDSIAKILVPTAGGPHAPAAMRLAVLIGRQYEARVTALWVAGPEMSAQTVAQGQRRVEQTIVAVREEVASTPRLGDSGVRQQDIAIDSQVVTADSVVEGILNAGAANDLVFIGASEEGLIDQVLFGSVPEQVARESSVPVVMVKHYPGLPQFWLQRAWDALAGALPQLNLEEQIGVYRLVRRGARPDADFFVMMGVAAIIATLGLLLDSAAVIIGAMLVAPLFTPIVAFSLAIVRGDVRLLLSALESTLKGVVLATGVALVLTALSPLKSVTHEITARIQPNLFDLGVALASGAAGAYATARRDVAASLPGVAIAAALVPPLCTIGIGMAMTSLPIVGGASLLFATNLIAIVLAGSVMFLLLGFRPARRGGRRLRLQIGLVVAAAVLVLITIPLATVFVQAVRTSRMQQVIQATLAEKIAEVDGIELETVVVERQGDEARVTATVYADHALGDNVTASLRDELDRSIDMRVHLRLVVIPVVEVPADP